MLNTVAILPFSRHSIATEYPCIEVVHQYHSDRGLGGGGGAQFQLPDVF